MNVIASVVGARWRALRAGASSGALQRIASSGYLVVVGVAAVILWCLYYERCPFTRSFQVPTAYGGDALWILGVSKAFSHLPAPWDLYVPDLNAPYGAEWNDYPHPDKLLLYVCGLLRTIFEPGVAVNTALLLAHVTAAIAFSAVARRLGAGIEAAIAGGLVFGFCPYIIGRGLSHLFLSVIWHIPVLFYLLRYAGGVESRPSRRTWILWGVYMALAASQSPYYAAFIFLIAGAATLRSVLLRRTDAAVFLGTILALGLAVFVLNETNVFLHRWQHGANEAMSGRDMQALLQWGLRLPDLFLPVSGYPIEAWSEFANEHYFHAGNPVTENSIAFLGIVGCVAVISLAAVAIKRGLAGRLHEIPLEAWLALAAIAFGVAGGLNYLVGALGFTWLRSTNRYSIVVLCAALLWVASQSSRLRHGFVRTSAAAGTLALATAELFGMRGAASERYEAQAAMVADDRALAQRLEAALPRRARVFQLPVMDFPESPPIVGMQDYQHFRPYVWSDDLQYSYAAHRGRIREGWQHDVASLPAPQMVDFLAGHGFDALLVDRSGYEDHGRGLEQALGELGIARLLQDRHGGRVAFKLGRRASVLPNESYGFRLDAGMLGWETGKDDRWSWASTSTRLILVSPADRVGQTVALEFGMESLVKRRVTVVVNRRVVAKRSLKPRAITDVSLRLRPRQVLTAIEFRTREPPLDPPGADDRKLAFRVINPKAE